MAHRLDDLIDKLFKEERDRSLARAWAEKLDADGIGDRAEALIREAAATTQRADGTEMTPRQARDYMADFARTIGVADHHVQASLTWLESADPANAADPTAAASMKRSSADGPPGGGPDRADDEAGPPANIGHRPTCRRNIAPRLRARSRHRWRRSSRVATRARCAPQPVAPPAPPRLRTPGRAR